MTEVRAPFPWFGGKRRVADVVWRAFGPDVPNYIEPFAGSLAVLLARPGGPGKIETVNDRDRYLCVAPETRILMADLTWRTAGELREGDPLLAFDEENPGAARPGFRAPSRYRRWQFARVVAAPRVKLPCYRLTFDDGTSVVASEDHCWLVGSKRTGKGGRGWRWVKTKSLVANRSTQRSWVLKLTDVTERSETWGAGWIAGLLDGEGSVISASAPRIILSQNEGPVLEQAEGWLRANRFEYQRDASKRCVRITIGGGLKEQMRLLMLARPQRLLRRFLEVVPQCSLYGRSHNAAGLVAKEYLGKQEVIALATTTKTFVAEGLASHNCNFWRAVSADPAAVAHAADWPVNEADLHARHKWLVNQTEFRERMHTDPDFYDVKIAGWWVWGICQWIGGGWCVEPNNHKHPKLDGIGKGVHSDTGHGKERNVRARQRPRMSGDHLGDGVHSERAGGALRGRPRPNLNSGQGVHALTVADRGRRGCEADHRKRPELDVHSDEAHEPKRQLPMLSVGTAGGVGSPGRGVHSDRAPMLRGTVSGGGGVLSLHSCEAYSAGCRPQLSSAGQGVHLPSLGNDRGLNGVAAAPCLDWFLALQQRLRRVRVACGDWKRVLSNSVLGKGKNVGGRRPCAVFLDPPYSHEFRDPYLYSEDDASVSAQVREWALDHGDDPKLRIALCGYAGEHEMPSGWTEHAWKAGRGYAGEDNDNREKERIWFSPHCLPVEQQRSLFA